MTSVEDARIRWIEERPRYEKFAEEMVTRLRGIVSGAGIAGQVSARPKEVHSLVKKLLAKPHLNYDNMPDKVGARVVVRYLHETSEVLRLVSEEFAVGKVDDTSKRLDVDRVGYRLTLETHSSLDVLAEESQPSLRGHGRSSLVRSW